MRVLITGATGTIGMAVVGALRARGDEVLALSRDAASARRRLGDAVEVRDWRDPARTAPPVDALAGADAIVHLIGEPVDQRWTAEAKRRIRDSRVSSTRRLVEALGALDASERPATLVAQSPASDGFLAEVVAEWEREAQATPPPVRVACTRTGVVLSPSGGALAK